MFGLDFLDVVIGIVFIFLMLSLISTAVNEMIEAFLKKRADYLERGIRELLRNLVNDENTKADGDLVAKIYNHPLIAGLYSGRYDLTAETRVFSDYWLSKLPIFPAFRRRKLPTYIPDEHFSQAFLDIVSNPGNVEFKRTELEQVTRAFGFDELRQRLENSKAEFSRRLTSFAAENFSDPTIEEKLSNLAAAADYGVLWSELRELIAAAPDQKVRTDLEKKLADLEAEFNERLVRRLAEYRSGLVGARRELENWYNNAMDRVSGWYKRRAQVMTFLLGLSIAVYLNVDTITIIKRLSHDKATRDSLSAAAQEYAKADAEKLKIGGGGSAQPSSSDSTPKIEDSPFRSCRENAASPECKFESYKSEITTLGLPIGWKKVSAGDANRTTVNALMDWHPFFDEDYLDQSRRESPSWLLKILGWLITGAAVSLGAPFWFDILNKFMIVRSTVKPKEKSKDEGSKDSQNT